MIVKIFVSHAKIARSMIKVIAIRLFIGGIKMDFKNDGIIGNLPKNINKEVPTPNADAKRITKLVKHDGDVVGYELSNGQRVSKDEGIQMAKIGEIAGVAVATRKGNEYLRSLPDENENNNLGNLPSITD